MCERMPPPSMRNEARITSPEAMFSFTSSSPSSTDVTFVCCRKCAPYLTAIEARYASVSWRKRCESGPNGGVSVGS
ncbi:hypothetical protein D3C83_166930 [compost metagenome]